MRTSGKYPRADLPLMIRLRWKTRKGYGGTSMIHCAVEIPVAACLAWAKDWVQPCSSVKGVVFYGLTSADAEAAAREIEYRQR